MNLKPKNGKIVVAGDWHGNVSWVSEFLRINQADDRDTIIQCGDFGYWEHYKEGAYYLDTISNNAGLRGFRIIWLDGNHENHDLLKERYLDNPDVLVTDEGFVQIRENIFYSPRANSWDWDGKRFMTVGGAVSINKAMRTLGKSWWAREVLSPEEVEVAKAVGKVDYLFTHDAPLNYPAQLWKRDEDSYMHRRMMTDIAEVARPEIWFHGHYHNATVYGFPEYGTSTRVIGLDCDGSLGNGAELDYWNGIVVDDRDGCPL